MFWRKKNTTFFSVRTFYLSVSPKLLSEMLLLLHISNDLIPLHERPRQREWEKADSATAIAVVAAAAVAAIADSFSL